MAYVPGSNLLTALTQGGLSSASVTLWVYVSTDSDLSGTYFSDGVQRGLHINDVILGIDTSGNTIKTYRVTALAAFDSLHPFANRAATTTAGYQIGN
jgi:hypothetical protein